MKSNKEIKEPLRESFTEDEIKEMYEAWKFEEWEESLEYHELMRGR